MRRLFVLCIADVLRKGGDVGLISLEEPFFDGPVNIDPGAPYALYEGMR